MPVMLIQSGGLTAWEVILTGTNFTQNIATLFENEIGLAPTVFGRPLVIKFTNTGVIRSANAATPALTTGVWPANTTIQLINNGEIYGAPGDGGDGGFADGLTQNAGPGQNGGNGGDAIQLLHDVSLTNTNKIYGGAGGGGGSGGLSAWSGANRYVMGGSGGGGGASAFAADGGAAGALGVATNAVPGSNGAPGLPGNVGTGAKGGDGGKAVTISAGFPTDGSEGIGSSSGNGGNGQTDPVNPAPLGTSGAGGGGWFGFNGGTCTLPTNPSFDSVRGAPGAGGIGGDAVASDSGTLLSLTNSGTIYGST